MKHSVSRTDAKLVCLGDSITYGYPWGPEYSWVNLLRQKIDIQLINQGVNGDSTGQMCRRFMAQVLQSGATHVHLLGGANDAWMGIAVSKAVGNMEKMLQQSLQQAIIPLVGLPTPLCPNPAGGASFLSGPAELKDMGKWLTDFSVGLSQLAASHNVELVDYFTPLCLNNTTVGNPVYFVDQCHLNKQGYEVMAQVALKALGTVINP